VSNTPFDEPVADFATLAAMVQDCPFHAWLGVKLQRLTTTV
jgi:hypothetical protein